MNTFVKTLLFSSLVCSMFTACSDDIVKEDDNGTNVPNTEWVSVTMQLGETVQNSNEGLDIPMTKTTSSTLWPESSPTDKFGQIPGTYPLDFVDETVYLAKLSDDKKSSIAAKAKVVNNKLTWLTSIGEDGKTVYVKGDADDSKTIELKDGDIVYFSSQENITKVEAGPYDLLGKEVFAPIGDKLFISQEPLKVNITNDYLILESEKIAEDLEKKDRYEIPVSKDAKHSTTMDMIYMERATTVLSIEVAFSTADGETANNFDYITKYINEKAGRELITDLSKQLRVRFFFRGYPNAYDMTKNFPIECNGNEYTAISYKWCYPVTNIYFPIGSNNFQYSGFRDESTPYITPHDFTEEKIITELYMTFDIKAVDAPENGNPIYRGTLKGEFSPFDIMKRNVHMGVLYVLPLSDFDGLLEREFKTNAVTRSAVEDELFGTILKTNAKFEYLAQ